METRLKEGEGVRESIRGGLGTHKSCTEKMNCYSITDMYTSLQRGRGGRGEIWEI